MKRYYAWAMVGLALSAPPSHAADCDSAMTQTDLNLCYANADAKSDATLNATYRDIVARLKDAADARKRLVSAEKAWIDYRDAECDFAASAETGGSIYPMLISMCRDALTRQRVQALKSYLACKEGDTLCPVPPK